MRVLIMTRDAAIEDADDLTSLSVRVPASLAEPGRHLSFGTVDVDGAHVWLPIDELPRLARRDEDTHWLAAYDAMVAFARDHGWLDTKGAYVRAHIELTS